MAYDPQPLLSQIKTELLSSSEFRYLDFLGAGGFGIVCKVENTQTGEVLALKLLQRQLLRGQQDQETARNRLLREILHHKRLSGHPLIVDFKKVFLTENFVCIAMEYAQGGNMYKYVTDCYSNYTQLTEDDARGWFQQLIIALRFCHKQNIVNRDVKLENTLRAYDTCGDRQGWWGEKCKYNNNQPNKYYLKLCDFGYSKDTEQNSDPKTRDGTFRYTSPEVFFLEKGQTYDGKKRDVWACGVMLYCMLVASYPFEPKRTTYDVFLSLLRSASYVYPKDFHLSDEVKELISNMLKPDPKERYSVDQIIEHAWFQKNLPPNWDFDFEDLVAKTSAAKQSDGEVEQLLDQVFVSVPERDLNQIIDDQVDFVDDII
eukprot:TRINITY_DN4135_c0_g1_i2.p1 TRINITY_DN4135_c0_g1~~TRINITY_DN4135_c0_g1_i2.p1  ORF type:complete len:373 (-),score=33.48 TRINITY_DN4135_c0_g1_i2:238-1356(-)